jgi:hypothetical protein
MFASSGCMHRRLTILSDPPGAVVLIDGEEVGTTPVGYDYTYYGTRHITLIKDGYKTKTVPLVLNTPWYQLFPLDFVTDNFALTKINDHRRVVYPLEPEVLMPTEDLRGRANAIRSDALRSEGFFPSGPRP